MTKEVVYIMICCGLACIMLFGNRKARTLEILWQQIQVFKNAKKNKLSAWDIICFVAFPVVLGGVLTFGLGCVVDKELAIALTTVFSIVFTVLFGFAAILVTKLEKAKGIEQRVVKETFVSLMTCTIMALLSTVFSVIVIKAVNAVLINIMSFCLWSMSLIMIMIMMMISKRIFILYCDNESDRDNNE